MADNEQLMRVERGFVEQFLQGSRRDAYTLGQPCVGIALVAQFVADNVAYVYLHSGCYLRAWLPNPHKYSDGRRQKKEGEQSRLHLAVVGITFCG